MKSFGIVGGGLAGMACGIKLLILGNQVTIFEKGKIPSLKVCGEYLSLEVLPLLESLGVQLNLEKQPFIDRLSCRSGSKFLEKQLPLGGIGISRQALDGTLKNRFLELGGNYQENSTVLSVEKATLTLKGEDTSRHFDVIVNASGRLNPFHEHISSSTLFAAYKKQVPALGWPIDLIHLEFFPWGYFGCSRIENDRVCICLLVKQEHLKRIKSIERLEKGIYLLDSQLADVFAQEGPRVAISNFQFFPYQKASIPAVGDAGGNIPPLVGNGMSLAITAGDKLATCFEMGIEPNYAAQNNRIRLGMSLNSLSMSMLIGSAMEVLSLNTYFSQSLFRLTHGRPW